MVQLSSINKITDEQKTILLKIARDSILAYIEDKNVEDFRQAMYKKYKDDLFYLKSGVFVTLTIDNELRGCIGNILAVDTILDSVIDNALNAGFSDSRFMPISKEEFEAMKIEISILTPLVPCSLKDIKIGDGVYIDYNDHSATFLPQVWDELESINAFMSHLCIKAGLEAYAYKSDIIRFYKYKVINFIE